DFEFESCGNMILAVNEAELQTLRASAEIDQERGLPVEFLDSDRVQELAPGLSGLILGGNYCSTDAQANPMLAMSSLARHSRKAGVDFRVRTGVERIDVAKGGTLQVVA